MTDEGVDDDVDDYSVALRNKADLEDYFTLQDQDNLITFEGEEARNIPHLGMNSVSVKQDGGDFLNSKRRFFVHPSQSNEVEIPMVAKLKDGELAVVLTWNQGSQIVGNNVELQDLDLHVEFQPTDSVLCDVDSYSRQCNGVQLTADSLWFDNDIHNV